MGNTEEDRAVVKKKSFEESGKVDCAAEDTDEWVAALYWFRLEEKGSDVVVLFKHTGSWTQDHIWWENIKGVSASDREEIWSKPFSFIATF